MKKQVSSVEWILCSERQPEKPANRVGANYLIARMIPTKSGPRCLVEKGYWGIDESDWDAENEVYDDTYGWLEADYLEGEFYDYNNITNEVVAWAEFPSFDFSEYKAE